MLANFFVKKEWAVRDLQKILTTAIIFLLEIAKSSPLGL